MTTPTSPTNVNNKIPLEDGSGYLLMENGDYLLYEWYALAPDYHTKTSPTDGRQHEEATSSRQMTQPAASKTYTKAG